MIDQLIAAGRRIVESGIAKGWAGSLSSRYQGKIVITRSGADLGSLTESDFVFVNPRMDPARNRLPRPSSELGLHYAAYAAHADIQAVLHVHSPQAISLGLLGHPLPALTPEFYWHVGAMVPLLPYITPMSEGLDTAVSLALRSIPAVLLQNHGLVVTGQSISQALLRLNLLDEQCRIYLSALAAGQPRLLSKEDMRALDEAFQEKNK
jgi:L-fuculose-phosphate aldolase